MKWKKYAASVLQQKGTYSICIFFYHRVLGAALVRKQHKGKMTQM